MSDDTTSDLTLIERALVTALAAAIVSAIRRDEDSTKRESGGGTTTRTEPSLVRSPV